MAIGAVLFTLALWQAWRFRVRGDNTARTRVSLAAIGIAGIAISTLGLLVMLTHALLVARQAGNSAYVLSYYSWTTLFGVAGFACSLFNSGRSRILACTCGLLITFLWYQVSLGA
jgi:hypothetical protein